MKCPNCGFNNRENAKVCENCGEVFQPNPQSQDISEEELTPSSREFWREGSIGGFISWFFSAILSFLASVFILLIVIGILLRVLVYQCRLNIPIPPDWDFLPEVVIYYWNWADEWQMKHCPDLIEGNYFFGSEPLLTFISQEENAESIQTPECAPGSITFSPWSAPAGTTFGISLDGFAPNETIHACWYFPSSALVNCANLIADNQGHRETVYWSEDLDPIGEYRMDAHGACATASVKWTVE